MQIVISREAAYETLKFWVVVAARKAPQRLNGVTEHCSHNLSVRRLCLAVVASFAHPCACSSS